MGSRRCSDERPDFGTSVDRCCYRAAGVATWWRRHGRVATAIPCLLTLYATFAECGACVSRATSPFPKRAVIYERAPKALPGSYKLWHAYLRERLDHARPHPISHTAYASLNNTFERALATMHKMPRVWALYLASLLDQRLLTRGRHAFDRALRALPVTQHDRIWPLYLRLASLHACPVETSFRVFRRYLQFDPSHAEDFIEFLVSSNRWQEAADRLASVLNDDGFRWQEAADRLASTSCLQHLRRRCACFASP
ncbi:uncharacterized protein [Lolium perenne]|uniref:uncharacterized protein n=1 Tax=Lolium perenne TaxID=4522 RepID=UPI003A9A0F38